MSDTPDNVVPPKDAAAAPPRPQVKGGLQIALVLAVIGLVIAGGLVTHSRLQVAAERGKAQVETIRAKQAHQEAVQQLQASEQRRRQVDQQRLLDRRQAAEAQEKLVRLYRDWLQNPDAPPTIGTEQVVAAAQQAVENRRWLASEQPQRAAAAAELAACCEELALLYRESGQDEQAVEQLGDAVEIRRRLVDEHPDDPAQAAALAQTYGHLAAQARLAHDYPRALDWYQQAAQTAESAASADPDNQAARELLITAWTGQAISLTRMDRPDDAVAAWDRVVQLTTGRHQLSARVDRALAQARAGDRAAAVAEVDQLLAGGELGGEIHYGLAAVMAAVVEAAGEDEQVDENERPALQAQLADRAVELIEKAIAAGWLGDDPSDPLRAESMAAYLENDAALEPLREQAPFRALLKRIQDGQAVPAVTETTD